MCQTSLIIDESSQNLDSLEPICRALNLVLAHHVPHRHDHACRSQDLQISGSHGTRGHRLVSYSMHDPNRCVPCSPFASTACLVYIDDKVLLCGLGKPCLRIRFTSCSISRSPCSYTAVHAYGSKLHIMISQNNASKAPQRSRTHQAPCGRSVHLF